MKNIIIIIALMMGVYSAEAQIAQSASFDGNWEGGGLNTANTKSSYFFNWLDISVELTEKSVIPSSMAASINVYTRLVGGGPRTLVHTIPAASFNYLGNSYRYQIQFPYSVSENFHDKNVEVVLSNLNFNTVNAQWDWTGGGATGQPPASYNINTIEPLNYSVQGVDALVLYGNDAGCGDVTFDASFGLNTFTKFTHYFADVNLFKLQDDGSMNFLETISAHAYAGLPTQPPSFYVSFNNQYTIGDDNYAVVVNNIEAYKDINKTIIQTTPSDKWSHNRYRSYVTNAPPVSYNAYGPRSSTYLSGMSNTVSLEDVYGEVFYSKVIDRNFNQNYLFEWDGAPESSTKSLPYILCNSGNQIFINKDQDNHPFFGEFEYRLELIQCDANYNELTLLASELDIFQMGNLTQYFANTASIFNGILVNNPIGYYKIKFIGYSQNCPGQIDRTLEEIFIEFNQRTLVNKFSVNDVKNNKWSDDNHTDAASQAVTKYSVCNTGLEIVFDGTNNTAVNRGKYRVDVLDIAGGLPVDAPVLWEGNDITIPANSKATDILFSNITGEFPGSGNVHTLWTDINSNNGSNTLTGSERFIRVTTTDACGIEYKEYFKVQFNAPATSNTFQLDLKNNGSSFPGGSIFAYNVTSTGTFFGSNNIDNATLLSTAPSSTAGTWNSLGAWSGSILLNNTNGEFEKMSFEIEEVNSSGSHIQDVMSAPSTDLLNASTSYIDIDINNSNSNFNTIWTSPYSQAYFGLNAATVANKFYKASVTVSSYCPGVPDVTHTAFFNFKGKYSGGTWNSSAVALRSIASSNSDNDKNIAEATLFQGMLHIDVILSEEASFGMEVYSLTGEKMNMSIENTILDKGKYIYQFDKSHLASGTYIIHYMIDGASSSEKLFIE